MLTLKYSVNRDITGTGGVGGGGESGAAVPSGRIQKIQKTAKLIFYIIFFLISALNGFYSIEETAENLLNNYDFKKFIISVTRDHCDY